MVFPQPCATRKHHNEINQRTANYPRIIHLTIIADVLKVFIFFSNFLYDFFDLKKLVCKRTIFKARNKPTPHNKPNPLQHYLTPNLLPLL